MTERGGPFRTPRRRWASAALLVAGWLAACTMPPLATPTPQESPTPSPTASPTPTPPPPTATPDPTPDVAAVPDFAAGELVVTLIDGLRVRQRPLTGASIVTRLLPLGAELEVVMGPFPSDDFSWYLVLDADPDEPQFEEGWVAAGYEPDPFLGTTRDVVVGHPFVTSMAGRGEAEEGPIEIGDGDHAIRWIAADPERRGCAFAVSLTPVGGEPVAVIRATVGGGVDRGTLQPQTFDALGVRGPAFASVASDCDWAFVLLRVPEVKPSPSAP